MYDQRRVVRKRWPLPIRLLIAALIATGLVYMVWVFLVRGSTQISDAKNSPIFKTTSATPDNLKLWTKNAFSFKLPDNWEETTPEDGSTYQWISTKKGYQNRWLQVYVDKIPEKREINKVLPIIVNGNRLAYTQMSDDCVQFTAVGQKVGERALETAPGIYQGVKFNCDLAKPRNVLGALSKDMGYKTRVVGASGAVHTYFFVYVDHSTIPDYTIFTDALDSFTAL